MISETTSHQKSTSFFFKMQQRLGNLNVLQLIVISIFIFITATCCYCHHVKRFQSAVQMFLDNDSMTLGKSQILVVARVAVVVPELVPKVEKLVAHAFFLLFSAHYQALSFNLIIHLSFVSQFSPVLGILQSLFLYLPKTFSQDFQGFP